MKNGRKEFIETMHDLVEQDDRILLVVGDVGFTFMEDFYTKHPNNFLNTGVMEQTMMGMACGLAKAGWKPYVYTMINFVIFRPYEQVRNDIAYQNNNVKLFGVAGSAAYKFLGRSHNVYDGEEHKLLDHLPNLNTYYPERSKDVRKIMLEEHKREGPSYMRI